MRHFASYALTTESLGTVLSEVRRTPGYTTNFFVAPDRWAEWLQPGVGILHDSDRRVALLLRAEGRCQRLFFAGDKAGFGAALAEAALPVGQNVAFDAIGRATDAAALAAICQSAGFQPYLRVTRLARSCAPVPVSAPVANAAEAAHAGDAAAIESMLDRHFDLLADQLPVEPEILSAIACGHITCVRAGDGRCCGFLWSERTGLSGLIRYWCVEPYSRGGGVGAALMRDYFARMASCARHLLWVREDNDKAAACYRHYGYVPDGLEDHVLVWRGES